MKHGKKVFVQLAISYVIFALLVLISFIFIMAFTIFYISRGSIRSLDPFEVVREDGTVDKNAGFLRVGGWVEQLDQNYQIVKIYGTKKDTVEKYTREEIYELGKMKDTGEKYRAFIVPHKSNGVWNYYIAKINHLVIDVQYNIVVNHIDRLPFTSVLTGVAFIILFLACCLFEATYISKKIKRPLRKITDGMERVSAGEPDVRLEFHAQQEFEQIRDGFNLMMEELEHQKKEKELLEQKKTRLLLDLSHDIKTPTASIKSYANALEAGLIEDNRKLQVYQTIDAKADRVSSLVDDMFTMLKLESTEYELCKEKTDLCELVRKICVEYYDEIEERGLAFQIDIPEEPYYLELDPKLMSRVVSNLLSNAVKYADGKEVLVKLYPSKDRITLLVGEDGEALSEELSQTLFDPFMRGDQARKTTGGTGLGLSIAKAIVKKHEGEIKYKYENGKNLFIVSLNI